MRVLYFSNRLGPHDQRFLEALSKTRHEVHFLGLEGRGDLRGAVRVPAGIHDVTWARMSGAFAWWMVPELVGAFRGVLEQVEPDLIHAGPIQTCGLVAAASGFRPLLTMSWGFDLMQDAERDLLWKWATRYTLRRSTYFVSDAAVTRDRAVAFGMARENTAVFPWGVDLRLFRPTARVRSQARATPGIRPRRTGEGVGRRDFVLLCNRSWEPRYGVDVLAKAFVKVSARLPNMSLILIGSGSEATKIRSILAEVEKPDRVFLVGRLPSSEVHRWYRKADLFISPSHVDGSSVSLMEALASGTPALVSDIPANQEWIRDGVNGWLFRDGDAEHLAAKILWIQGQPRMLARIARQARKTAEERADWTSNFKILLRAYEDALALVEPAG